MFKMVASFKEMERGKCPQGAPIRLKLFSFLKKECEEMGGRYIIIYTCLYV